MKKKPHIEQRWTDYLPLRASPLKDEAVLIAAFPWGNWTHPMVVTAIFIFIQNPEGLFYAPRIVGNYVGLHPMTVIVSIFVWGLIIGGVIGPLLAVPLTATLNVLFERYVWGRHLRDHPLPIETALTSEGANFQLIVSATTREV